MNPQYYQPLSAALHAPVVAALTSQPQYPDYGSHARDAPAAGTAHQQHREEEEEEEDEDEEVVEEELEHHDAHQAPSVQSSPRAPPSAQSSSFTGPGGAAISHQFNTINPGQDQTNQSGEADGSEKRKPGRPRGSRNRKPRAAPGTASQSASKVPVNSQHPGFYQYPPAPGNTAAQAQNQQFYEFQWRALNLCSEFYNAAEELVKAASPIVIAQCYQMGPTTKIDPLAMISEAKRVCDNLLANPSQLVGSSPPPATPMYSQVQAYPTMPPPPPAPPSGPPGGTPQQPVPVITNPQSFVMSLGAPGPPGGHPQPYYPPMYAQPGSRYPTTPYYSYAPGAAYYAQPPPPPQSISVAASAPPPQINHVSPAPPPPSAPATSVSAPPATTGTLSTFNAATGNAAPGGQQGTWSEEETERLRKLAEQSRDVGGAQSKGEIEWDWVVHQWGNSRTRHQILLKATSMGLKESTTRGTKRRRENENSAPDGSTTPSAPQQASPPIQHQPQPPPSQPQPPLSQSAPPPPPLQASPTQSPSTIPSSRPATTTPTIAPNRISSGSTSATTPSTSTMPWPMPTVAANTPSPVLAHAQTEANRTASSGYYRPRQPGQQPPPQQQQPQQQQLHSGQQPYAAPPSARPPSSHGSTGGPMHDYMYRPNGAQSGARRQNGI